MELTPMHRILKMEEVRHAMLKSADTQLGAIHPANRLDLNNFYNCCTGCLAATKQLQVFSRIGHQECLDLNRKIEK